MEEQPEVDGTVDYSDGRQIRSCADIFGGFIQLKA